MNYQVRYKKVHSGKPVQFSPFGPSSLFSKDRSVFGQWTVLFFILGPVKVFWSAHFDEGLPCYPLNRPVKPSRIVYIYSWPSTLDLTQIIKNISWKLPVTDLSLDLRSMLDSVMARIRGLRKKASSGVRVTGTFVNNI